MTIHFKVIASHGIGNQLFQYAFAHYLAQTMPSSEYKISFENSPIVSKLAAGKSANFELQKISNFCSHFDFKTHHVISNYSILGRFLFRTRLSNLIYNLTLKKYTYDTLIETRETSFKFMPFDFPKSSTVFSGFWQHYKYVLTCNTLLFREIDTFLNFVCSPDLHLNLSRGEDYIAVHVRRGDFQIRGRDQELGLISENSYLEILSEIQRKNGKLKVITFTDDVKLLESFKFRRQFGEIFSINVLDTLKIMSKSTHVIAANSTLSWWGGFIALHNGANVYLPKKYYKSLHTHDAFKFPGFKEYENDFN